LVRAGLVGRLLGGPVATAVLLERRGSEEKKLDDDRGERQTIYIYHRGWTSTGMGRGCLLPKGELGSPSCYPCLWSFCKTDD